MPVETEPPAVAPVKSDFPVQPAAKTPEGPTSPAQKPTEPAKGEPKPMPQVGTGRVPDLGSTRPGAQRKHRDMRPSMHIAQPPPLKLKPLSPPKKKDEPKIQQPIARPTLEQLTQKQPLKPEDLLKPAAPVVPVEEEEDDD